MVSQNAAKANPTTTATVSVSGSGGSLPNGVYRTAYTFVDAFGETLMGGESATFTQTTAATPTVTLPSKPTGVSAMNLYLTPAGGASGSEVLYATGITGTTFVCSYAAPVDPNGTPPAANTTGAAIHSALIYSILDSNGSIQQKQISQFIASYLHGDPMERREYFLRFGRYEGILRMWLTLMTELRTLVAANPGTLGFTSNVSVVTNKQIRTFS